MKRRIRKAAVLGSGVMGSGIACHFANIGLEVLMLDMTTELAQQSLKKAIASKPAPLYDKSLAQNIRVGSLDKDLGELSDYDWIIEVVI